MTAASTAYSGDPVAVIGNGPVGQTAALLLAHWGIPVVLLDSRLERDPIGSKAICQQRDVLDVWETVGAGRQIADEGVTWTRGRTFYKEHELFTVEFTERGRSAFPPWVNISQSRSEEILDVQIAASPLIDVRWDHDVVSLQQDDDQVTVTCRGHDGAATVRAPYVVACGGARSDPLRAMLGLSFEGRTFEDYFLICDIRTNLPDWENERRFYFDPEWNPGRQVLVHPCPDSTFRIDWQVPPDFDITAEVESGGLERRIRQIIGDLDYEIVWQSVYRFHSRHIDRFRVGRVLVAGDCAHLVAPFGARGLNSGVQDAENAAWKIAFVLNGWGGEALLDSYHDERLAAAKENLEVTTATMDFLVPQSDAEWKHRREVLDAAVSDPEAREQVDSGRLAEPFWYADSPLTTPDPSRRFPGRPPRGETPVVVPGVLIPDVPISIEGDPASRTRDIARSGFLILVTEGVDADAAGAAAAGATQAPVRVHALADIDTEGLLAKALEARPGEAWLVRPDGHIAAVLPGGDPGALSDAVRRATGSSGG